MAVILAVDTSADACSVALNIHGDIHTRFELAPRTHTQLILPMVDEVLSQAGMRLNQLDALAFGRGPGSFTGLRIAAGIVQGLAYGADLPVVPISTLAAMGLQGVKSTKAELALCAVDARMNEVYWGVYKQDASGVLLVGQECVCAPADLPLLAGETPVSAVGVGSGWLFRDTMPSAIAELPQQVMQDLLPSAEYVAALAEPAWQQGQYVAAYDASPVYLRDTVTWKKLPGRE